MRIYLVLAALIAAITAEEKVTVEIKISKKAINEGESFTVDCTAINQGFNIVRINKRIPGDKEGEYVLTTGVASNMYLEPNYEELQSRYNVKIEEDDPKTKRTTFRLTVTDAEVKDGGVFQCSVQDHMEVQDTILVRAPPTELDLYFYNGTTGKEHKIKNGDSFTFQEHETARIKCVVNGSNPEPMARIQVGDRKITANEGLVVHPPKKYDISTSEEYRRGQVTHQYDTVLEIENLHVMNYGNQNLKCAAHTHHMNIKPELHKAFKLKMKGMKPVLECNTTQLLHLYEKDGTISCKVHGIPPPTKFSWYTYSEDIEEDAYKIEIEEGNDKGGAYRGRTAIDHDGGIVMKLIISRVHDQHFRRHWFIAENTMGSTELEINVEQDPNVNVVLGGGSALPSVMFVSLVLPLLATFCHL